jgi:hypothetical protein
MICEYCGAEMEAVNDWDEFYYFCNDCCSTVHIYTCDDGTLFEDWYDGRE